MPYEMLYWNASNFWVAAGGHKIAQVGCAGILVSDTFCGLMRELPRKGQEFWQAGIYEMPNGVDPSGCGDAFTAGLVIGIVKGWDLPVMIRYASALGASAIHAPGTTDGVFTAKQAAEFITENHLEVQSGKFQ